MALFTADTARKAALLSHAPTSARHATAIPPPLPATIPHTTAMPAMPCDDGYSIQVLMRTRRQLDLVAQRILDELEERAPDSRRLRDLSDAQRHLAEQERILAGRPLPGSRRPSADPKGRKSDWWIEMQPSAPAIPLVIEPIQQCQEQKAGTILHGAQVPACQVLPARTSLDAPALPSAGTGQVPYGPLPGDVTP